MVTSAERQAAPFVRRPQRVAVLYIIHGEEILIPPGAVMGTEFINPYENGACPPESQSGMVAQKPCSVQSSDSVIPARVVA